jgi:hypothetical protein
MTLYQTLPATTAPKATVFIWASSDGCFCQTIQKFLFSESLGTGRLAKIGIPDPALTASFIWVVEIVF